MRHIIRSSARLALLWQITAGLLLGGDLLLTILLYPQNTFKIPFLFVFLIVGVYMVLLGTKYRRPVCQAAPLSRAAVSRNSAHHSSSHSA